MLYELCYDTCTTPVRHDDQQGTACVTIPSIISTLKLTGKKMISEAKFVFLGAGGASNTTGLRLILTDSNKPQKFIMFNTKDCRAAQEQAGCEG